MPRTEAMPVQERPVYRVPRNAPAMPAPDAARNQCLVVLGLFCFGVAACWVGAPAMLRYLFPAGALLVAIFLFARSRIGYIGFVFFLYFFSPFLRRMVDFRAGFLPVSPLLLAPIFATAVSGYVLVTRPRTLGKPGGLPFACALAGIFFGTVVGLTHYAPMDVGRAFLNWVPPVLFGFFVYEERDRYAEYERAITRTLLVATPAMAVYGIVQFLGLFPWDIQWVVDMRASVFGLPEAMKLRVFATMNSPAPFASYMMSGILLAICIRNRMRPFVVAPAFVALILSSSRASWVGLAGGVLYLGFRFKRRGRLELMGAIALCCVLTATAVVVPVEQIQSMVTARLKSMADPNHDVSYRARFDGHVAALASLANEPFGEGLGSADTDHATDGLDDRMGPHDSTMLECLYALGGPGTLIYMLGVVFGVVKVGRMRVDDPFAIGMSAIVVAYATECMLNSIFVGVLGFMVWTAAGMSLAAAERGRS